MGYFAVPAGQAPLERKLPPPAAMAHPKNTPVASNARPEYGRRGAPAPRIPRMSGPSIDTMMALRAVHDKYKKDDQPKQPKKPNGMLPPPAALGKFDPNWVPPQQPGPMHGPDMPDHPHQWPSNRPSSTTQSRGNWGKSGLTAQRSQEESSRAGGHYQTQISRGRPPAPNSTAPNQNSVTMSRSNWGRTDSQMTRPTTPGAGHTVTTLPKVGNTVGGNHTFARPNRAPLLPGIHDNPMGDTTPEYRPSGGFGRNVSRLNNRPASEM